MFHGGGWKESAFLRVGVVAATIALALAAGVAVTVGSSAKEPAPATASTETESAAPDTPDNKFEPGEKLELPSERREAEALPVSGQDWPGPSRREISAANAPRYYQPSGDADLALTIDDIGLYNVPVMDSGTEEALDRGVIHLPETPMPWEEREQKNVYLAGHRVGYEDTGSRMVFFNLDKLQKGDSIVLTDRQGTPYEYQVNEVFVVEPDAEWVVDPVRDRDMLTLQTCTYPTFENRIIVRADRV